MYSKEGGENYGNSYYIRRNQEFSPDQVILYFKIFSLKWSTQINLLVVELLKRKLIYISILCKDT